MAAQKRVAEEWLRRAQKLGVQAPGAKDAYASLPLTIRTTFDAVTHALATTKLTSKATGAPMGTAIDLIDFVDEVAGEIPGARGDQQFRVYAYLKPNVISILTESKEFSRSMDNTVYHPGYPICFRLNGGVPSIQISIARNELSADIDVDYRSAKFPAALVNGHLSSSNSDVRAGNNIDRHISRWSGLSAWWRNLFGFALESEKSAPVQSAESRKQPSTVAEAADDFLDRWLVQGDGRMAASYFSRSSFDCSPVRGDRAEAREGLMRVRLALAMQKFIEQRGRAKQIREVVEPVTLWDSRLTAVPHANSEVYLLAKVPKFIVASYLCLDPDAGAAERARKHDHYASVMRIKGTQAPAVLYLLWSKEGGRWRIVSFESGDPAQLKPPESSQRRGQEPAARVVADLSLVAAVRDFHSTWLVEQNPKKALNFLDVQAFGCVAEETGASAVRLSQKAARRRLIDGMQNAIDAIGKKTNLAEVIRNPGDPPAPARVVIHPDAQDLLIIELPDEFAAEVACGKPTPRFQPGAASTYTASHYASAAQIEMDGEPAAFWMLWSKSAKGWKARYWKVMVP